MAILVICVLLWWLYVSRVPLIPGRSLFGGRKSGVHIQFRWGLFKTVVNYHTRLFILLGDKRFKLLFNQFVFKSNRKERNLSKEIYTNVRQETRGVTHGPNELTPGLRG